MNAVLLRMPVGESTSVPDIPGGILYLLHDFLASSFDDVAIPLIAADACVLGSLLYSKVHCFEVLLEVLQVYALY